MELSSPASRRVRFGVFEADLSTSELRKRGRKVKLQEQPFQLLALLLEHAGAIVTREEVQQALWGRDTFVELDQSVNTAIKKIRQALDDSADNPRFIETLPRKGYRFIGLVTRVEPEIVTDAARESPERGSPPAHAKGAHKSLRRRLLIVGSALVLCATISLTWWLARKTATNSGIVSNSKLTQITRDVGFTGLPAFSRDGKFLAYTSDRAAAGNLDIWIQHMESGSAVRITDHEAADYFPDFSPDGRSIVFRSDRDGGGIYVIPALGGEARLLAKGGRYPRFSPEGTHIAYYVGTQLSFEGTKTFVIPSGGGLPQQMVPDFRAAAGPAWAPDGKHLVLAGVHPTKGFDWWVTSLDGSFLAESGMAEVLNRQRIGLQDLDAFDRNDEYLLFSGKSGDAVNIWRLPMSTRTWRATGPAERLTFGVNESWATVGPQGRMAFQSGTGQVDVWALPVDVNGAVVRGELQQLSRGGASACTISADGRTLVFRSAPARGFEIVTKDLVSQREIAITDSPKIFKSMPRISPDGLKVAFSQRRPEQPDVPETFVMPARGGPMELICRDCGAPSSWSSDGRKLVAVRSVREKSTIHLIDVETGHHRLLLDHPSLPLYVGRLSWDDQWIAFKADLDMQRTQIFVAPLRGWQAPPPQEWIAVTEGKAWDDLPRWSPAGNLIYFTSDRDGYRCIWARRLEPRTKRLLGVPFAIRHFHEIQRSMSIIGLGGMDLALARDKLVFPLAEVKGNIWMLEPASRHR